MHIAALLLTGKDNISSKNKLNYKPDQYMSVRRIKLESCGIIYSL